MPSPISPQEFGSGDIRLTVMQSFYIINVPNEKIDAVVERAWKPSVCRSKRRAVRRGVVACTGIEFCNLAVTETKERAKNIVNLLDEGVKWNESEFFRINVNGCPNSCGQHWIADVGLQGCTKKVDGAICRTLRCVSGRRSGRRRSGAPSTARQARHGREVPHAIDSDRALSRTQRQGDESFADFCARHSEEELAEIL